MFCPKCGAANDDVSNFCKNCSQPLAAARDNLQKTAPPAPNPVAPQFQANPYIKMNTPNSPGTAGHAKRGMKPWMIVLLTIVCVVVAFIVLSEVLSDADPVDGGTSASQADGNLNDEISDASTDDSIAAQSTAVDKTELNHILNMDVFDWSSASAEEKSNTALAIQQLWKAGGITGEAVNTTSSELVQKISERMGDQANVFEEACTAFGIDPQPWRDMVS